MVEKLNAMNSRTNKLLPIDFEIADNYEITYLLLIHEHIYNPDVLQLIADRL